MDVKWTASRAAAREVRGSSQRWPSLKRKSETSRDAHDSRYCTYVLISSANEAFSEKEGEQKEKRSKVRDLRVPHRATEAVRELSLSTPDAFPSTGKARGEQERPV